METNQVADLLRFCASLDGWLKQTDPAEGAVMVVGWSAILAGVDAEFALDYARRHYSRANARTIQPGDIRGAWITAQTRDDHQQPAPPASGAVACPESLATYMQALVAASRAGRDPAAVPRPEGLQVMATELDVVTRRCVDHKTCNCTHTECRDGWLDDDVTKVSHAGRKYRAVKRCPLCAEAAVMKAELAGMRGRRRR